jgi:hypothetical protein
LQSPSTEEGIEKEKGFLNDIAKLFLEKRPKEILVAHGTQSPFSLCQILLDGRVKCFENKCGPLGSYDRNTNKTGYYDNGWGVFVAKRETLESAEVEIVRTAEKETKIYKIPLKDLEAILLPTLAVDIVRTEFPEHAQMLKSYLEFANELNQRLRLYRISVGKEPHKQLKQVLIDVNLYLGEEIKEDERFDYQYFPITKDVEEEIDQYIRGIIQKRELGERNSDGNKKYNLSYREDIPESLIARLDKITTEE